MRYQRGRMLCKPLLLRQSGPAGSTHTNNTGPITLEIFQRTRRPDLAGWPKQDLANFLLGTLSLCGHQPGEVYKERAKESVITSKLLFLKPLTGPIPECRTSLRCQAWRDLGMRSSCRSQAVGSQKYLKKRNEYQEVPGKCKHLRSIYHHLLNLQP